MRRIRLWTRRLLVPLAVLAVFTGGCGGSDSDDGGNPTQPTPALVFTPVSGGTGPRVSMRAGGATNASELELEIVASNLTDVFVVDFVLSYPGELLRLESATVGPFLDPAQLILTPLTADSAILVTTRLVGSGATGSGVIATIRLPVVGAGIGTLGFVEPEAERPTGQAIEGIEWLGGTVQITR